jgi:uncharacterized protein YcfJ
MRFNRLLILVPAAILAAACGRDDSNKRVDDALNSDLSLAAQARPYTALDSISAAERAAIAQGIAPVGYVGGQPVYATPRAAVQTPVRRTTSTRRSSSGGGTVYSAPARRQTIVKHTKRDAAIGAGAGAIIGAVTSRDKVKGAVIGGLAGAVLGGVIGNNVDKTKR